MALVAVNALAVMILVNIVQLIPESAQKPTRGTETRRFFEIRGNNASLKYMSDLRDQRNFTVILLRSTDDGYLCLKNSSDPSQLSHSEQANRVVLDISSRRFILTNLSLSDSGEYVTERWVKGTLRKKRLYSLLVCQNECNTQSSSLYSKAEIMIKITNESHGYRLQIYKEEITDDFPEYIIQTSLVVDTRLPVEVLPDGQRGIVEMSSNSTAVYISTPVRHGDAYAFVVWSGGQCCSRWFGEISQVGPRVSIRPYSHFIKPHERLTLPCYGLTKYVEEVLWKTPGKDLSIDVSLPFNMSNQEEEDMYIDTRNYSLIIPSTEVEHTGTYKCRPDFVDLDYGPDNVFVCSDLEATTVLFSIGGAAALVCGTKVNITKAGCTFYQHVGPEQEHQTLNIEQMKAINEKRMSKKQMSRIQFSMTMSNLTLNDSGLYYCRVWGHAEEGTLFCFDGKIYLLHKHPFGIHSTFYRVYSALMACGLLGMICAVISVNLSIRARHQVSQETLAKTAELPGCPIGKQEPRGGESAYDNVDTAEDSI